MINPKSTINCGGEILDLSAPKVMGILNVTEDSFFPASRFKQEDIILKQSEKMLLAGAAILDIGGMSSRPGAKVIDVDEELKRVIPAIEIIHKHFPAAIISVDTIRSKVAKAGVEAGARMVNDISAGRFDKDYYPTLARLQVPYVLMHMQRQPENMQKKPQYDDVVQEVLDFLIVEVDRLRQLGMKDIIIDPGFGFGKSLEHNYQLLRSLHVFQMLDLPILAGLSRKSMIYKLLEIGPEEAQNGTSVLHLAALQQGAKILRVHDVEPAIEVIRLWEMVR